MYLVVLSAVVLGTPVSWIERPITAPDGRVEAEIDARANPDDRGGWLGADVRISYGLSDRLELGGRVLTAATYPSDCSECTRFGGVIAEAQYRLARTLALTGELGYARPDGIPFLRYLPPAYAYYTLVPSIGLGLSFRARVGGRVAIASAPRIDVQTGSEAGESNFGSVYTFNAPVSLHVQATSQLVVYLESGAWAVRDNGGGGNWYHGFPLIAGAQYAVDHQLDLGIAAGSFAVDELASDTLYFGVSATWRTK